jgi:hypothetical protein
MRDERLERLLPESDAPVAPTHWSFGQLAAIACADALTAKYGGVMNQKNHAAIAKLLRATLGKQLPAAQAARLSRLLARKDEAQYGASAVRRADAARLLDDLNKFAEWPKASWNVDPALA